MIYLASVDLNITGLNEKLIEAMINIGNDCSYEVKRYGNELLFRCKRAYRFTELVSRLKIVCECYNVDYVDLLV
jgi:hypothetical protein